MKKEASGKPLFFCVALFLLYCLLFRLHRMMMMMMMMINKSAYTPNQQRTLNKLPTELRCRNFDKYAPTELTNRVPDLQKRVGNVYIFQLSFHFACHRWWLGKRKKTTKSLRVFHYFPSTQRMRRHFKVFFSHTFFGGGKKKKQVKIFRFLSVIPFLGRKGRKEKCVRNM